MRVAHVTTIDLTVVVLLMPQLRALRDAGYEVSAISAPGEFQAEIEAEGISHIPWRNATRAWDPMADLRACAELIGILHRGRFDLVHTHNAKPGFIGRIAARTVGVPRVVNTVHGFDATPDDPLTKRAAFMGLEWIAAQFSDLELYQGRQDQLRARRLGMVGSTKGRFLGNGVNLTRFQPDAVSPTSVKALKRDIGIPEGATVVGMVGRLVAEKGYRELFAAAALVHERFPQTHFLAVGDRDVAKGDCITDGEIKRAEEDGISFLGWQRLMPNVLAAMDVFVLPSWREGVPRSALEAAAMGLPLVLSDIPGCRQLCRQGVDGFLVPLKQPAALAEKICRLVADPGLRMRMGAAAQQHASERMDERDVIRRLLDAYDWLLSGKGVAR
jgi:glycosyltransferase involved in cell wall biosynthesis